VDSARQLHRQAEPDRERKLVDECLQRIIRSPFFQGSKRSQELLQYLVAKRLEGDIGALKERVIGAELFDRNPSYDTSADAIVRVKMNEVRKRLAAYYGQEGRDDPVRIELPVGSYAPVFHWVQPGANALTNPDSAGADNGISPPLARAAIRSAITGRRLLLAFGLVLVVASAWLISRPAETALDRFWAPYYHSKQPVLVCIPARDRWFFDASVARALAEAARLGETRLELRLQPGDVAVVPHGEMSVQNFRAILQLATHLARRGASTEMRLVSEVSVEEIRRSQVILVGAYHNPWAMELSRGMRYSFESEDEGSRETCWVRDRNATGKPLWLVPRLWPYAVQSVDYAIISRTFTPFTGQVVVSLAGINGFGTQVAAEFLTVPRYWQEFTRLAPAGWERRNCQIVIEAKVVREVPNPPRILAVHVW
jgi:hypothetical protein